MHRSGTSCLAGTLEQAGVYLGSVSDHNEYNKKGNKENTLVMNLNNEILFYNQSRWDKPPQELSWLKEHEKKGLSIINEFESNCKTQYWGFKDPRVLLTLPFWKKLIPKARYVGTYRDPYSVSQSLENRRGSSIDLKSGLNLWFIYNQQLINFYKEKSFPIISFDLSSEEYNEKLRKVCTIHSLTYSQDTIFFDKALRNHKYTHNKYNSQILKTIKYLNKVSI